MKGVQVRTGIEFSCSQFSFTHSRNELYIFKLVSVQTLFNGYIKEKQGDIWLFVVYWGLKVTDIAVGDKGRWLDVVN